MSEQLDPRVRIQLEAIIGDLVFKAASIYFRGQSRDVIVAAVESKLDCKFLDGMPLATQEELRREIREMIISRYDRRYSAPANGPSGR